jgi:hypothetical protein
MAYQVSKQVAKWSSRLLVGTIPGDFRGITLATFFFYQYKEIKENLLRGT